MQKIKSQFAVIVLCAAAATLLNGCGQSKLPPPNLVPNELGSPSNPMPVNQHGNQTVQPVNTNQPQAVPVSPISQPAPAQTPPGQG